MANLQAFTAKKERIGVKTSSILLMGMVVLGLGLLAGCTQGAAQNNEGLQNQLTQLSNQVQTLTTEVQTLKGQLDTANKDLAQLKSAGSTGLGGQSLKVGFVNAEEVFVKYQGTEQAIQAFRAEKEAKEKELSDLKDQFSAGTISQNAYTTKSTELTTQLSQLDQQLTADITEKIVAAVQAIGANMGLDLITARKNVVLYYKENGIVEDLTDKVLQYMNEALVTTPSNP